MSDDIVTRLRGQVIDPARASYHLSYELDVSDLCLNAADEIERLREELAQWKEIWTLTRDEELRLQVELAHARLELRRALGRTCRCVNTGATYVG